jgi:hypothetical protein
MRTSMRILMLVAGIVTVFTSLAGASQASTWQNTGDTAFTATSSGGSLSTAAGTFVCTGATMTGTAGASSPGPAWTGAVSGAITFSPCRIGGTTYLLICSGYRLDALAYNRATDVVSSIVVFTSACSYRVGSPTGTEICRLTGSFTATYVNPAATSTRGRLTTGTSNLTAVNGAGGSCLFGNGVSVLLSQTVFTVSAGSGGPTPHLGPNVRQP